MQVQLPMSIIPSPLFLTLIPIIIIIITGRNVEGLIYDASPLS